MTWQGNVPLTIEGAKLGFDLGKITTTGALPELNSSVYTLDATGRPIQLQHDVESDGVIDLTITYSYANCRLIATAASGKFTDTGTYEYDAVGNLIARRYSSGAVELFDYSCW